MKTMILTAAMMILMSAAAVNAAPDSTFTRDSNLDKVNAVVNLQKDNIIEFRVEKPVYEKVVLKIFSDRNDKVYEKTLRKEKGIALECDMRNMESGTYTCVVVSNGRELVRKSVTIR